MAVTRGAAIEKLRRTIRADSRSSLRLQHVQFGPELSTAAEDSFENIYVLTHASHRVIPATPASWKCLFLFK